MTLALTSTAFQEGANIAGQYTGDGRNISPRSSGRTRQQVLSRNGIRAICESGTRGLVAIW